MAKYRVLQGMDYPPNKRAEIGDIVEDIPAQSVSWLLESQIIEDTSKPEKTKAGLKLVEPIVEEILESVQTEPIVGTADELAISVEEK